jgi:Spy/CpxP family protein refolding chaperone
MHTHVLARLLMVLSALALPVGAALAGLPGEGQASRERPYKWWKAEEVKAELSLSPQQSDQLEQIFQDMLPKLREGKAELDRTEAGLSRLLADTASDEGEVIEAIDRAETARAELGKTRTLMLFRMRKVLSADQNTKLKALHERQRGTHERRRNDRP